MATVVMASRDRRFEHWFFSGALLILATIAYGFARSYFLAGMFRAHLPNALIHVHAAVFMGSMLRCSWDGLCWSPKLLSLRLEKLGGIVASALAGFSWYSSSSSSSSFSLLLTVRRRRRRRARGIPCMNQHQAVQLQGDSRT